MPLDLDHFKSIKDTHGHLIGDEVLKNLAQPLRDNLRADDLIGRYGGEKFVAILCGISQTEAVALAERLMDQIRLCRTLDNHLWGCTVSTGLAPLQPGMKAHYAWP